MKEIDADLEKDPSLASEVCKKLTAFASELVAQGENFKLAPSKLLEGAQAVQFRIRFSMLPEHHHSGSGEGCPFFIVAKDGLSNDGGGDIKKAIQEFFARENLRLIFTQKFGKHDYGKTKDIQAKPGIAAVGGEMELFLTNHCLSYLHDQDLDGDARAGDLFKKIILLHTRFLVSKCAIPQFGRFSTEPRPS